MKIDDLKKIVGSLLVLGFEGTQVSTSLKNFLEQWDLGGVILFKRNIESLEQVRELNRSIYTFAKVTPLVSVDHEGGRVFRLPEPFTIFPPMLRVGEICQSSSEGALAEEVGKAMGRELRWAGFNLDYAPVLDVHSNAQNPIIGDRAFSRDPETVASWALPFLQGLEAEGIQGCGKHFPGHGDTAEDSHLTLPRVEKTRSQLEGCEWIPFRKAIASGISLLMTAHILYPALDVDWPATLSEKILVDLLRRDMGYEGLIISDDFFMKGITERWSIEVAAERFLRSGGDLVLLCHQEAVQRRVAAHLVHVAETDVDFLKNLQEKVRRIAGFRDSLSRGVGRKNFNLFREDHVKLVEKINKFPLSVA